MLYNHISTPKRSKPVRCRARHNMQRRSVRRGRAPNSQSRKRSTLTAHLTGKHCIVVSWSQPRVGSAQSLQALAVLCKTQCRGVGALHITIYTYFFKRWEHCRIPMYLLLVLLFVLYYTKYQGRCCCRALMYSFVSSVQLLFNQWWAARL